jgi:hypothetical protein
MEQRLPPSSTAAGGSLTYATPATNTIPTYSAFCGSGVDMACFCGASTPACWFNVDGWVGLVYVTTAG